MKNSQRLKNSIFVTLSITLLIGVGINAAVRPNPTDATFFHEQAKDIIKSLPLRIGNWEGREQEIPASAIKLLQPNAIISRTYTNRITHQVVSLLIVQTKDARDMVGHYPPICYPANGYKQTQEHPIDWNIDGVQMHGTDYSYQMLKNKTIVKLNVVNFIIMPNGEVAADMNQLNRAAADYTRHFDGAAQIQLVTTENYTNEQRETIFKELIQPNIKIITTLLNGSAKLNIEKQ